MDTPLTPALAAHSRLRQTLILLAAIYLLSSLALLAWRAPDCALPSCGVAVWARRCCWQG